MAMTILWIFSPTARRKICVQLDQSCLDVWPEFGTESETAAYLLAALWFQAGAAVPVTEPGKRKQINGTIY